MTNSDYQSSVGYTSCYTAGYMHASAWFIANVSDSLILRDISLDRSRLSTACTLRWVIACPVFRRIAHLVNFFVRIPASYPSCV